MRQSFSPAYPPPSNSTRSRRIQNELKKDGYIHKPGVLMKIVNVVITLILQNTN